MLAKSLKGAFALIFLSLSTSVMAGAILGTGTGALKGNDLTDPENDADSNAYVNYNADFRASVEQYFSAEGAFNVFDNLVGPNNAKWCCDMPTDNREIWVEADFGDNRFFLDAFTVTSGNDVPGRDADHWAILGSNDGINYTEIFSYNNQGVSVWNQRLQVVEYASAMGDFAVQDTAYSIFRYQAYSVVSGNMHQINEIEFFGTQAADIPEPSNLMLFGLGLLGLAARRFKR